MADLIKEEMTDFQREIKSEELVQWLSLPITQEFQRRMLDLFNPHRAILGEGRGATIDLIQGQERVMEYVINPALLMQDS